MLGVLRGDERLVKYGKEIEALEYIPSICYIFTSFIEVYVGSSANSQLL